MNRDRSPDEVGRRRRAGAVADVLDDGLPEIAAAVRWGAQIADVRRWIATARADQNPSPDVAGTDPAGTGRAG
ncbi:hypothetical protein ACU61A_30755 [Pseudonocardia sichuanensis]